MTIDKQKLQKLLWAKAASFRADCADWKRNTEALQEFLGEKTVEEVALDLLAENTALRSDVETWRLSITAERNCHKTEKEGLQQELNRLKGPAFAEELTALRKDAERYQWLRENAQQDVDGWRNEIPVLVHAMSHIPEWKARIDESIDAGIAGAVQP